jgi:hypothetical protein
VRHERDPGSDTDAYDESVASITPLLLDLTDRANVSGTTAIAAAVSRPKA